MYQVTTKCMTDSSKLLDLSIH